MSNPNVAFPVGGIGETLQLDLANPDHYRFASDLLARSGSSETLPQSGGGTAARADAAPWLAIPYLVTLTGKRFRSRAIARLPLKIDRATLILSLYDTTTQTQFATSSVTQRHGLFMTDGVRGQLPGPESDGVSALATLYVFMPNDPIPTVYTTRRTWKPNHAVGSTDAAVPARADVSSSFAIAACQLAPAYAATTHGPCVNDGPAGPPIRVCAAEVSIDCDYQVPAGANVFGAPVSGSAQFNEPLQLPLSGTCAIAFDPPDAPPLAYSFELATSPYFQGSANTVEWNIPAAAFPLSGDVSGLFHYDLFLQTTLASGQPAFVMFTSSGEAHPGAFTVPPLMRIQS